MNKPAFCRALSSAQKTPCMKPKICWVEQKPFLSSMGRVLKAASPLHLKDLDSLIARERAL
jgi:hypothetical protein